MGVQGWDGEVLQRRKENAPSWVPAKVLVNTERLTGFSEEAGLTDK